MKTKIATLCLAFVSWAPAYAGDAPGPSPAIPANVALQWGNDLSEALPAKLVARLASPPVRLVPGKLPQIRPAFITNGTKISCQIIISQGFVDLVNQLAWAKAMDRSRPGFFKQFVQKYDPSSGSNAAVQLPAMSDRRFKPREFANDQATYFNQMFGLIVAMNLAHHYLGYSYKYGAGMASADGPASINELLTPEEWSLSLKAGATDALNCALSADGVGTLFDALAGMSKRPAWTRLIVPTGVDLKKLHNDLVLYEKAFYHGALKWPTPQIPVPGVAAGDLPHKPGPETAQSPPGPFRRNRASND